MNAVIKAGVHYKRSELTSFIEKLRSLVKEQDNEFQRSLIGRGKYRLKAEYSFLEVSERQWFSFTEPQKLSHLKKFSDLPVASQLNIPSGSIASPLKPASLSVDVKG